MKSTTGGEKVIAPWYTREQWIRIPLLLWLLPLLCLLALVHEAYSLPNTMAFSERIDDIELSTLQIPIIEMTSNKIFPKIMTSKIQEERQILVVYSGPTSMDRTQEGKNKQELYHRNMIYFMKHGVDCRSQDTVFVVTREVRPHYQDQIRKMNLKCLPHNHSVQLLVREPECYDLETVRTVFFNSNVNVASYDYFVYVNCGMSGPFVNKHANQLPWTNQLISLLNDNVKMSGLTAYCPNSPRREHIQSFVYALDRVGLDIILKSNAIFDCRQVGFTWSLTRYIVYNYEIGMGQAILNSGHGLASLLPRIVIMPENRTKCSNFDIWGKSGLTKKFGHIPSCNETLFFKSSRLLTKEVAQMIEYPGKPHWEKK